MLSNAAVEARELTLTWCGPGDTVVALARIQDASNGFVVLTDVDRMTVEEIVMMKTSLRRGRCLLGAPCDAGGEFFSVIGRAMRSLVQRCGVPMDEVVAMTGEHIADAFGVASAGRVTVGAVARFAAFSNQFALREVLVT
jgi:N-acyl-D-aspartate/D-glutamate deacylase